MVKTVLESTRVIAIVRGIQGNDLDQLVAALYEGGIRLAEVTMNTPGSAGAISRLQERYDGRMCIGAGTVTNITRAKEALACGAQFVVTPNVNGEVIRLCLEREVLITPGALTPTEVVAAMELGCQYVKLFPARSMGPAYVKDLLGPLDNAKILVVGGIGADNAAAYIQNGAVGVGVGGTLCAVPAHGDYAQISQQARRLIHVCQPAGIVE